MRTFRFAVALFAALAVPLLAHAEDAAVKAILEKAIQAHGGKEKLAKHKAVLTRAEGTLETMGLTMKFTQESRIQTPDQFSDQMTLDINGMQINLRTVYNKGKGWVNVNGMTMELEGDALKEMKEALRGLQLVRMAFLDDLKAGKIEALPLGEMKVDDKTTVGVRLSGKEQKDVSLYFDKETGLLTKMERDGTDPQSGQVYKEERIVKEYQDFDGMKSAKNIVVHRDGKKFLEATVTEVKGLDKLDDSEFAKP